MAWDLPGIGRQRNAGHGNRHARVSVSRPGGQRKLLPQGTDGEGRRETCFTFTAGPWGRTHLDIQIAPCGPGYRQGGYCFVGQAGLPMCRDGPPLCLRTPAAWLPSLWTTGFYRCAGIPGSAQAALPVKQQHRFTEQYSGTGRSTWGHMGRKALSGGKPQSYPYQT